jgi:hypothetical protein
VFLIYFAKGSIFSTTQSYVTNVAFH